jgi:hypothetical protein
MVDDQRQVKMHDSAPMEKHDSVQLEKHNIMPMEKHDGVSMEKHNGVQEEMHAMQRDGMQVMQHQIVQQEAIKIMKHDSVKIDAVGDQTSVAKCASIDNECKIMATQRESMAKMEQGINAAADDIGCSWLCPADAPQMQKLDVAADNINDAVAARNCIDQRVEPEAATSPCLAGNIRCETEGQGMAPSELLPKAASNRSTGLRKSDVDVESDVTSASENQRSFCQTELDSTAAVSAKQRIIFQDEHDFGHRNQLDDAADSISENARHQQLESAIVVESDLASKSTGQDLAYVNGAYVNVKPFSIDAGDALVDADAVDPDAADTNPVDADAVGTNTTDADTAADASPSNLLRVEHDDVADTASAVSEMLCTSG